MEPSDIFPCCMMKLPALHTRAHTAKKLVTDQQTARSSNTDATANSLAKYRTSNRLTGEYPQLTED